MNLLFEASTVSFICRVYDPVLAEGFVVLDMEVLVEEVADIVESSKAVEVKHGEGATGSSGVGCAYGGCANTVSVKGIEERHAMTG